MQTKDIMSTHVYTIAPNENTVTAARTMRDADVGCLVVVDNGAARGMVTDRDLTIGCLSEGHDARKCEVSHHMSSPPLVAEPTVDMIETAHIMNEYQVSRLPVVENGSVIGLVSLSDIAAAIGKAKQSMDELLNDLLLGMGAARSA